MKIVFVCLCWLFASSAYSLTLTEQRELFSQAVDFQKEKEWSEAQKKALRIPDYPLFYLLEYKQLKENFSRDSVPAVQSFINNHASKSVSNDLQRSYLYYLAKNEYWREFLDFYPKLPNSPALQCFYFQARMANNQSELIWHDVRAIWLTGNSLPNACDSVLQYYLQNKKISQPLIWQRFQLAYAKNQQALMSYLISLMDKRNTALAKPLVAIYKSPKKLLKSALFVNREQASYDFLIPSIKRLAKKEIKFGLRAYLNYQHKISFTSAENTLLKKYLISRILIKGEESLFIWSDNMLLNLKDSALIEQRIRYAIKLDNWHDIEYWLAQLSDKKKQENKWLYWQARVLENQQQLTEANKRYRKIATKRNYYGFLAAQKLALDYQFNTQLVTFEADKLNNLDAALEHIDELVFHQYPHLLKREWGKLLRLQDTVVQQQLGLYALQKNWAYLSVLASIQSKSWDALNIRFPVTKPELFSSNAQKYQLDSSYIYAITRQESSFDESARSPAGARGYMQLMPQTAKETARKIGLKTYRKKEQLAQGEINVPLGTGYFDFLIKRYNGNRILATAAYNAGPNRVSRWQSNKPGRAEQALAMDHWIEAIPYKETRRYVKNVLAYNVIYQHVLGKPLQFLTPAELNARY